MDVRRILDNGANESSVSAATLSDAAAVAILVREEVEEDVVRDGIFEEVRRGSKPDSSARVKLFSSSSSLSSSSSEIP